MSNQILIHSKEQLKKILRGYYLEGTNIYDIFKHNLIQKELVYLFLTSGYYSLYLNGYLPQKIMIGTNCVSLKYKEKEKMKKELSFVSPRKGTKSNLYWELMAHQELLTPPKSLSPSSSFLDDDVLTF